jgi:hypothetical protein
METKMQQFRGIVIHSGLQFSPSGVAKGLDGDGGIPLIRRCLLYWDRIEWPASSAIHVGGGPEEDFLISTGLLSRHLTNCSGRIRSGNPAALFAHAQLAAFERLEKENPGAWSIAQEAEVLRFPGQIVAKKRTLEFELYNALPTPAETVPFADILEFRERYSSELRSLRSALDDMYLEILGSPDPARVKLVVTAKISKALKDIDEALVGKKIARWKSSFSVEFKGDNFAKLAASALSALMGAPIALSELGNMVVSTFKWQDAPVPTPASGRNGPFAYLYHAQRELRSS